MSKHRRRRKGITAMTRTEQARARVLAAADQLVGERGLSALSLNALADALHKRPSSILRLFRDIEEILDEVTLRAQEELVELLQDAVAGRDGREALESLLDAQRLYAQARPGKYEAAVRKPTIVTPIVARLMEARAAVECAALQACGASAEEAAQLAWCLRAAVHGAISLEATDRISKPHEIDRNFDRFVSMIEAGARATWVMPSRPSRLATPRLVANGSERV